MPIAAEKLDILCCPITRVGLKPLSPKALAELNQRIGQSDPSVRSYTGSIVTEMLEDGLVTASQEWIYPIIEGDIPVMLVEYAISTEGLSRPLFD